MSSQPFLNPEAIGSFSKGPAGNNLNGVLPSNSGMHDHVLCVKLLRVVTGKVKVEIVGRILPRLIGPLSVNALNLQMNSDFSMAVAPEREGLTKFVSQLAVDLFQLSKLAAPTLDHASADWFSNPANLHQ